MSFLKTASIASAGLFVAISIANAEQVSLSTEQLDQVTAGAITPIPSLPTFQPSDGNISPRFPGPLQPEPAPPPPPPPASNPSPSGPGGILTALLQAFLGGFGN